MVTFGVTASGSPPLIYAWQLSPTHGASWDAIAGGTAPNYSIQCKSNMTGWEFRVIVSNAHGTAMSSTALLGVV
jgi:hypothetical protein